MTCRLGGGCSILLSYEGEGSILKGHMGTMRQQPWCAIITSRPEQLGERTRRCARGADRPSSAGASERAGAASVASVCPLWSVGSARRCPLGPKLPVGCADGLPNPPLQVWLPRRTESIVPRPRSIPEKANTAHYPGGGPKTRVCALHSRTSDGGPGPDAVGGRAPGAAGKPTILADREAFHERAAAAVSILFRLLRR